MSRAININAPSSEIMATAAKLGVAISAIETLDSGGTRVILMNEEGAASVAKAYGKRIIEGDVTRTPWKQQGI